MESLLFTRAKTSARAIVMTSAECLFNTAVPLTVRSGASVGAGNNFYFSSSSAPFFTTNVTPVQFQDDQGGRRINSVVFEIYLHTIIANKKVKRNRVLNLYFYRF